jgi:hypothetical protein
MSDRVQELIDRIEDVRCDGEAVEPFDRVVEMQPPVSGPIKENGVISLTFGDLQDGTGFQFKRQHLERFKAPARVDYGEWYELAGWIRDYPDEAGVGR